MAGLNNSMRSGNVDFSGHWEDIQNYTTVKVTIQSPIDGSGTLQWCNTNKRQYPTNLEDVIASDLLVYTASMALTVEYPTRGRYFRLIYNNAKPFTSLSFSDMSLNIDTLYKMAPDAIEITDGKTNGSTSVTEHAYQVCYTDICGNNENIAIYTTLSDSSSDFLGTTDGKNKSIFVALRDNSNSNLTYTETHNLYVHQSDSQGHSQAGTVSVSGALKPGVALYLSGSDTNHSWSTSKTKSDIRNKDNAVYVVLTDSSGNVVSNTHPIPVKAGVESGGIATIDIQNGVTQNFVSYGGFAAAYVTIFNLFTYNNGPNTVWTKVYNMSLGMIKPSDLPPLDTDNQLDFSAYDPWIVCNIATPPGQHRDLSFPKGLALSNGMFLRSAVEHRYSSSNGPGQDVLFINGNVYTDANVTFFVVVTVEEVRNYLTIIVTNDGIRRLALSPNSSDAIIWFTLQESGILVTPINGQYWAPYYSNAVNNYVPLEIYDPIKNNTYYGINDKGVIYNIGTPTTSVTLSTVSQGNQSRQAAGTGATGGTFGTSNSSTSKILRPSVDGLSAMSAVTIPAEYRFSNPTIPTPPYLFIQNSRGEYLTLTDGALSLTRNESNAYVWQVLSDQTLVATSANVQYALKVESEIIKAEPCIPGSTDYFTYIDNKITRVMSNSTWSVLSNYPTCTPQLTETPETFVSTQTSYRDNAEQSYYIIQTPDRDGSYLTVVDNALSLASNNLFSYVWTIMSNDVVCAVTGGDTLAIVCDPTNSDNILLQPYNPNDASMYYTVSGSVTAGAGPSPRLVSHNNVVDLDLKVGDDNAIPLYFSKSDVENTNVPSQYLYIKQNQSKYMTLVDVTDQITLSATDDSKTAYVWSIYGNNVVVALTSDTTYALVCNTDSGPIYAEEYDNTNTDNYYKWTVCGSTTGLLSSQGTYVKYNGLYATWSPSYSADEVLTISTADNSYTSLTTDNYNIGVLDKFLTTAPGFLSTDVSRNANVWNILPNNVITTIQGNYLWPMIYNSDTSLILGEPYNPSNVNNYYVRMIDTSILTSSGNSVKMIFDTCAKSIPRGNTTTDQSVCFVPATERETIRLFSLPTGEDTDYIAAGVTTDDIPYVGKSGHPEAPPNSDSKYNSCYYNVLPNGGVVGTILDDVLYVLTDNDDNTEITVRPYSPSIPKDDCYSFKDHVNGDTKFKTLTKGSGEDKKILDLTTLAPIDPGTATKQTCEPVLQTDNNKYKNIKTRNGKLWTVLDNNRIGLTDKKSRAFAWTTLPDNTLIAKGPRGKTYGITNTAEGTAISVAPYDANQPELYCKRNDDKITNENGDLQIYNTDDDTLVWGPVGSELDFDLTTDIESNIKDRQGTLLHNKKYATLIKGALSLTTKAKDAYPIKALYNDVMVFFDEEGVQRALKCDKRRGAILTEEYNPLNIKSYYKYTDDGHIEGNDGDETQYINFDDNIVKRTPVPPVNKYFTLTAKKVNNIPLPCYNIVYMHDRTHMYLYINAYGLLDVTDLISAYVWNVLPNGVIVCLTNNTDMWALNVPENDGDITCVLYDPDNTETYYKFVANKVGDTTGVIQGENGSTYIISSNGKTVTQQILSAGLTGTSMLLKTTSNTTSPLQGGVLTVSGKVTKYLADTGEKITQSLTAQTWYLLPNMVIVDSKQGNNAISTVNNVVKVIAYDSAVDSQYYRYSQSSLKTDSLALYYSNKTDGVTAASSGFNKTIIFASNTSAKDMLKQYEKDITYYSRR